MFSVTEKKLTTRKPSAKDFTFCRKCGSPVIETGEYIEELKAYRKTGVCLECGFTVTDIEE